MSKLHTEQSQLVNNLYDASTRVHVTVRTPSVADWGDYEAYVLPNQEWGHYVIPLESLTQPTWAKGVPLDLTTAQYISFGLEGAGDFELSIDNIALDGAVPVVLADFEQGMVTSQLSTSFQANPTASSTMQLSLLSPGAANSQAALFAQGHSTLLQGSSFTLPLVADNQSNFDLTQYTGISFDLRLTNHFNIVGEAVEPLQSHNVSCADLSLASEPTACAIDQGEMFPPITDGYQGAQPDVGAYETGIPRWSAGAQFVEDWSTCQNPPDATFTLPPVPTFQQSLDASVADASVVDSSSPNDDGGDASTIDSEGNVGLTSSQQSDDSSCNCSVPGRAPLPSWIQALGFLAASIAVGLRRWRKPETIRSGENR
jgi:hypothetical protein